MHKGLEFFPPGTPQAVRRRRLAFLAVWAVVSAMVVWPLYPWLGARDTLVLGLPASLGWVILALGIQFAALLWLYRAEEDSDDPAAMEPADEDRPAEKTT